MDKYFWKRKTSFLSDYPKPTVSPGVLTAAASELDDASTQDSWVELAPPSRGSVSSSVDAVLLIEAQQQSNASSAKGSRHSPKSLQSPNVEFEDLEKVKVKLAGDMLPPGRGSDWIWDWSSRPEAIPPKPKKVERAAEEGSSVVTTPPNSPVPSPGHHYPLSLRHCKLVKSQFFRAEVLLGLVVSNLFAFLLGACIGFCLCSKMYEGDALEPSTRA